MKVGLKLRIRERLRRLFNRDDSGALRIAKREVLGVVLKSGCVFCHRERKVLEQFFFWYLHEGYGEPGNLERMSRSHGLCPEHTRRLLAEGLPQTIASIYAPLLSESIKDLRRAGDEVRASRDPEQIAAGLAPKGRCPACAVRDRNVEYLAHSLQATLYDAEVREALERTLFVICWPHLLESASQFGWEELRFLVDMMIRNLERAEAKSGPDAGAAKDLHSTIWMLWSAVQEGEHHDHHSTTEQDAHQSGLSEADAAWSPTVAKLRRRLSEPGCPVCRARRRALEVYFDWLSAEVSEPAHRWRDALELCPEHGREFASRGDEDAALRLARAVLEYRASKLERLAAALRRKPPERLLARLAEIPGRVREKHAADDGQRRQTLRSELRIAFVKALRPPGKILPELREPAFRVYHCPACRCLNTAAARTCDLISRALNDHETLRIYQQSSGICFRHLPQTVGFSTDPAASNTLLRAQKVRLELLQWEIREYQRKQSWTLRYEPKGPEQDVSRRAVARYTGV